MEYDIRRFRNERVDIFRMAFAILDTLNMAILESCEVVVERNDTMPFLASRSQRREPIKPAPPVTNTNFVAITIDYTACGVSSMTHHRGISAPAL